MQKLQTNSPIQVKSCDIKIRTLYQIGYFCQSPTQPQHELELDLIMELLRHFQATNENGRQTHFFLKN